MGKATQDLKNEHEAILNVLAITEKKLSQKQDDDTVIIKFGYELVDFLKVFADKCHHGKEEGILFPEMVKAGVKKEGRLIGVMHQEHILGREYIAAMAQALDDGNVDNFSYFATKYTDLLRNHITKENEVLFKLADNLISENRQIELFRQFEIHEETVIGHGIHEQLHARIHRWEQDVK